MSSYFASLLTTTTSRVATLRQNLLPSENDGDTVDDTHLCRVLRSYYTEKQPNQPFPKFLPADPKAPQQAPVQPTYTSNVGAGYGGGMQNASASGGSMGRGAGGGALRSLWDRDSTTQPRGRPQGEAGNPFQSQPKESTASQAQPRLLPSKNPGSQQGMSARDRLAGRVGGRSQSPNINKLPQTQVANTYTTSSGGDYEDRFMPPANGYGGKRSGGGEKPFVAATSPWASNESEFGGGGYGGYSSSGGVRQGLPQRPNAGTKAPGLPSGPRAYR